MELRGYSIYDNQAKYFTPPFFMKNEAEAKRAFGEVANNPQSDACKFPNDFCLYEVGTFDDSTALLTMHPQPSNLGLAASYKRSSPEVTT